MKFEKFVETVCGQNWREVSKDDLDGGYAVAIFVSFIKGTPPTLKELARNIGLSERDIETPYNRLFQSGVFSDKFNARNDPELIGRTFNNKKDCRIIEWTQDQAYLNAWGHIAAVGSGAIFREYNPWEI
jgi:hypothetical protein